MERKPWLLSTVFRLLYDFLSMKNDVNVRSKSNKQKNLEKKIVFCWRLEGQWRTGSRSGSISQRQGSVPRCHGSATLSGPKSKRYYPTDSEHRFYEQHPTTLISSAFSSSSSSSSLISKSSSPCQRKQTEHGANQDILRSVITDPRPAGSTFESSLVTWRCSPKHRMRKWRGQLEPSLFSLYYGYRTQVWSGRCKLKTENEQEGVW